jgi:hypothetical protein
MLEYIERNKVLAEEEFFGEHATWDNPMADGCMAVRSDFIMNIPAADVAPVVHGYWIEGEKTYRHNWGSITVHQCNCSQCGYTQESSIWGGGISDSIKKTKYCPNCGAKMDGESNV